MSPLILQIFDSRARQETLLTLLGLSFILSSLLADFPGESYVLAGAFGGLHLLTLLPFLRQLRPAFFTTRLSLSLLLFVLTTHSEVGTQSVQLFLLLGFVVLTALENLVYQAVPEHQKLIFSPAHRALEGSLFTRALTIGYLTQTLFVVAFLLDASSIGLCALLIFTGLGFTISAKIAQRSVRQFRALTLQSIRNYDPEYILYFSAPPDTLYQTAMWYEYLEQLDGRMMILTRERNYYYEMRRAFRAPVVFVQHMNDLDLMLTPRLSTAFYVNNSIKNSQMIIHRQLCHVQLLHGDSDKAASYNPTTSMFDKIFVAGQLGIDRYENHGVLIPAQKFEIVGRPQLSQIERASERATPAPPRPTILYAPTWRGVNSAAAYSSVEIAEALLSSLLASDKYRVLVKLHPYTNKDPVFQKIVPRLRSLIEKAAEAQGVDHILLDVERPTLTLFECFNQSDAMIADVSSVVSDYIFSEKPFCLIDMMDHQAEMLREFPTAKVAYVLDSKLDHLEDCIEELFTHDSKRAERLAFRKYALGDFPNRKYAERFTEVANAIIHRSSGENAPTSPASPVV